jgi:hypothetical protein
LGYGVSAQWITIDTDIGVVEIAQVQKEMQLLFVLIVMIVVVVPRR